MIPHMTKHDMLPDVSHDEAARQDFVTDFRVHLASSVFPGNFPAYYGRVLPNFIKDKGREPENRHEVRKVMTHDPYYSMWSAMQRVSQEMIWDSVNDSVEREYESLREKSKQPAKLGSLTLNPDLEIPKYHVHADIHLQPGGYHTDITEDDIAAGATYDMGTYIYAMGGMGQGNDGLGWLLQNFMKEHAPDLKPKKILDMGCTTGNSTGAWAKAFPEAEIYAVDVGAPVLRYAHARAEALGHAIHFSQQNAEHTNFEDESFDLVISHILLHETSRTALPNVIKESHRLLKPGGLMLHMDLPQAHDAPPLEGFLFEWEIYNNNETFYGHLRSMDLDKILTDAGFSADKITRAGAKTIFDEDQQAYSEGGFEFPVLMAWK